MPQQEFVVFSIVCTFSLITICRNTGKGAVRKGGGGGGRGEGGGRGRGVNHKVGRKSSSFSSQGLYFQLV